MPTTLVAPAANRASLARALLRSQTRRHTQALRPQGLQLLAPAPISIPTDSLDEAGDQVVLLVFPAPVHLVDLELEVPVLDTGATPTLTYALKLLPSQGAEEMLLQGQTAGQTGGLHRLSGESTPLLGRDVSDASLVLEVETPAATPQAGAVTVRALIHVGGVLESW